MRARPRRGGQSDRESPPWVLGTPPAGGESHHLPEDREPRPGLQDQAVRSALSFYASKLPGARPPGRGVRAPGPWFSTECPGSSQTEGTQGSKNSVLGALKAEAGMVSPPPQASLTPRGAGKHEGPRAQALLGATPGEFHDPAVHRSAALTSEGRVGAGPGRTGRVRAGASHSPWKAAALALPGTS